MRNAVKVIMVCLLTGALASEAHAQSSDELELEEALGEDFVSIATGRKQPLRRAPAVASVITAEQIRLSGARTLDEVLETVPGLHVSVSSTRFTPVYAIRGIHTFDNPQVLMLVNGVPITQAFLGDRGAYSTLPVESIERVEVIRGPGSAVYGADAAVGVINVVTRSRRDERGNLINDGSEGGVRVGDFDTQDAWLMHFDDWGGFDVSFMLEGSHTNGDDDRIITADAQTLFDAATGTQVSNAPGPADTRLERLDLRLELTRDEWKARIWNWRQDDAGVGPGLAQALDPTGSAEINNHLLDIEFAPMWHGWDHKFRVSYMDIDTDSQQTLFPAGTVLPIDATGNVNPITGTPVLFPGGLIGNPGIQEEHWMAEWNMLGRIGDHRWRFALGGEHIVAEGTESKNFGPGVPVGTVTDVTGTPFVFQQKHDRDVLFASVQDEFSISNDLHLTAGLRHDNFSDFGDTTNPRLALVWDTSQNVTTKFLYGRAFRAPSFAELFNENNPVLLGNANLEPEVVDTLEAAIAWQPVFNVDVGFSVFFYEIDDLIQFVPGPSGAVAQNTGSIEGQGFELESDWRIDEAWRLKGHIAVQDSEDTASGADAPRAPQQQAYLSLAYTRGPWTLSGELNWVGERARAAGDPRARIDEYSAAHIAAHRVLARDWTAGFGIRNLTDEDVREPSPFEPLSPAGSFIPDDYPMPGRFLFADLRVEF